MEQNSIDLPRLFKAVTDRLILDQDALNAVDSFNHDHGDHMVEIFQVAAEAAAAKSGGAVHSYSSGNTRESGNSSTGLAEAMEYAAELLRGRPENGSAQVYARGLSELAGQFRQRGIGLGELAPYVQGTLQKQVTGAEVPEAGPVRSAEVLKALLNALSGWEKAEAGGPAPVGEPASGDAGQDPRKSNLDLGYLFGVGMSYLQARQKGGDALDILAETVVSASPLARVPYRHQSGKIAMRALLEAMGSFSA